MIRTSRSSSKQKPSGQYKDFYAEKHTQIKASHPHMSEVQIQKEINLQWQASQKKNVGSHNRSTSSKKLNNVSTKLKNIEEERIKVEITPRKLDLSEEHPKPISQESIKDSESVARAHSESSSDVVPNRKIKMIQKSQVRRAQRSEKRGFYKFYVHKIRSQHPRWSSKQILDIVLLLWKKKTLMSRQKASPSIKGRFRQISGRMAFRVSRSYYHEKISQEQISEINHKYKALPRESKIFWKKLGKQNFSQGTPEKEQSSYHKVFRSLNPESKEAFYESSPTAKTLNFMQNAMM